MYALFHSLVALLPLSMTLRTISGEKINGRTRYSLIKRYTGNDFFIEFDFKTFDDPTHGRVNYVSDSEARQKNLAYVTSHNNFVMKADSKNVVQQGQRGRDSVRIESKDTFGNGVYIADIYHTPTGCATWPAFWTCTTDAWPIGGEIDILEGVNGQGTNAGTLHTTEGCSMPRGINATGIQGNLQCASSNGDNTGCGVRDQRARSFGAEFNANGGGVYAMERANTGIRMWFWPRHTRMPKDIRTVAHHVDPSSWGIPFASFPSTSCDIPSHFSQHRIVWDLTFCGDWAGGVYGSSGCPGSSCEDHVDNQPEAFREAFWKIQGLRAYA
ncbi:hypothetical protein IAU60_000646 [Kwoniella sp. DSM 27419]